MGRTLLPGQDRATGSPACPAARPEGGPLVLSAYLATAGGIDTLETPLPPGAAGYPALTPRLGAAFWYERVIHDRFGVVPEGHPRLAPLIRPGTPEDYALPRHVAGYGVFTIPHGPVRSGVMESIEYLVETPGEAIPHLNMRVFYKHRGIADRFAGTTPADAVLLAERAEGIASVAHALAFCHAVEQIAGCQPPPAAGLVRVLHAELERIANHLDVAVRLADAAGLAVATARFALHKERVQRLVSALCGSRFGRGVVVPGGVGALPLLPPAQILTEADKLRRAVTADAGALMGTSSFLDRLRGTGPLTPARARQHGALGPIGKASGFADDARLARPYDGYPSLTRAARPRARRRRRAGPAAGQVGGGGPGVRPDPAGRRRIWPNGPPIPSGSAASPPEVGRSAGPKRRRARSSTTWSWPAAGSPAASPDRRRSTTWC